MSRSTTAHEALRPQGPEPASRWRVLLVDDVADVRRDLRVLLEVSGGFEVVGEAADGLGAIEQARLLQPDVVVMDLGMPGMDGIEAARRLKPELPGCRVVALTVQSDEAGRREALAAGFDAFVLKGSPLDEFLRAIRPAATPPSLRSLPNGGAS